MLLLTHVPGLSSGSLFSIICEPAVKWNSIVGSMWRGKISHVTPERKQKNKGAENILYYSMKCPQWPLHWALLLKFPTAHNSLRSYASIKVATHSKGQTSYSITSVSQQHCAASQRPPVGAGKPFLNILVQTVKILLKLNVGMNKMLQLLVLYLQHLAILSNQIACINF